MIDVAAQLDRTAASTARLLASLATLDDLAMAAPSQLPGWNRAQVVTHLARNADGFTGLYVAAQQGVVGRQYPHGSAGRAADIDAGRDRPAAQVVADVRAAIARLAGEAASLSVHQWEREGEVSSGPIVLWRTLLARRREVEVHHVDLGVGYGPDDWPPDFVAAELEVAAAALPARLEVTSALRLVTTDGMQWEAAGPDADAAAPAIVTGPAGQLLAWLLGRPTDLSPIPAIGPWQ